MGIRKLYNLYNVYSTNEPLILLYHVSCTCHASETAISEAGIHAVSTCMSTGKGSAVDLVGRY